MNTLAPEKLYYFSSAADITRAVEQGSLVWRSPATLDGITEVNHQTSVNYQADELIAPFVKTACSLIFSKEEPQGDSALINAIKRWREAERFTEVEEAEGVLRGLCSKIVEQYIQSQGSINKAWYDTCASTRFLSLFAKVDTFQVWQQYGDNFQGAALEFVAVEEGESILSEAKAVRYVNETPSLTTVKEQVQYLLHSKRIHPERHVVSKLLSKAHALRSQGEWRCFKEVETPEGSVPPEQWLSDLPFDGSSLATIYLGPAMPLDTKERLLIAAAQLETPIKLVQLSFSHGKFDLAAEVIGIGEENQRASGT